MLQVIRYTNVLGQHIYLFITLTLFDMYMIGYVFECLVTQVHVDLSMHWKYGYLNKWRHIWVIYKVGTVFSFLYYPFTY